MKTWWREVVSYPPSWIAIAAVLASVVAIIVLLEPSALLTAVVIGVGVVAIIVWPAMLVASGALQAQQRDEIPQMPELNAGEMRILRAELDRLDDPRPAYQLQAIGEKRDNLTSILDDRLDTGELTYSRYQSTGQQVYLAVISNLREVVIARKSTRTINPEYIDTRLAELREEDGLGTQAEISSLEDRRALATTQEAKATYLLAQNESAMTLLDRTATALADAPIGVAPQDAEAAMEALADLADRAGKYATP